MPQTYDTFSLGYEQGNVDEDEGGGGMKDQGIDGLDNDPTANAGNPQPNGTVDDPPQITRRTLARLSRA